MLEYDFENSIGYWVCATAHDLARALNEELSSHGITLRQWEVLAMLSFCGEQAQSELADRLKIEAPTLVGVLDRMERDGWIVRTADPHDKRRKIIRATEQVEPVWNKMVECAKRVRGKAVAGLGTGELETLRALLARVRDNIGRDVQPGELALPVRAADVAAKCQA
jgi:MarR family transcriptional regulator for hemolysin